MKAIVTVIGKDRKGIIAKVSNFLYENEINIEDITQTIMQDYFSMVMMVNTDAISVDFTEIFKGSLTDTEGNLYNFTYAIVGGNDAGLFNIFGKTITPESRLGADTYTFNVKVTASTTAEPVTFAVTVKINKKAIIYI